MASTQDNINAFIGAEASLSTFTPATIGGRAIYKYPGNNTYAQSSFGRVPLHIRTGNMAFGNPTERKRFSQIEFHGKGSLYVRIYVDGVWIADGTVTCTESPSKDRRFGIPVGTKGYCLDLEFCGDADVRAVEFTVTSMSSTS